MGGVEVNFLYTRSLTNGFSEVAVIDALQRQFPQLYAHYNSTDDAWVGKDFDLTIDLDEYKTLTSAYDECHKVISEFLLENF